MLSQMQIHMVTFQMLKKKTTSIPQNEINHNFKVQIINI